MTVPNYTPSYTNESPYGATPIVGDFMYYYTHRPLYPQSDDITVTMDNLKYVERPDLLAFDLYENSDLWWVFGVRNGWEDPVYDLVYGITMYLPSIDHIRNVI